MKRNRMTMAAAVVSALLFLLTLGASSASADTFNLTSCHISVGCLPAGTSYGTVTLTQNGANVDFSVTLDPVVGDRFVETGAGGMSLFLLNDALPGSTITSIASAPTTPSGGFSGVTNASPPIMANGTGTWTAAVQCAVSGNCNGGSAPNMTSLTFTVTNATLAQLEVPNGNGFNNMFVADILCPNCGGAGANGTGDVDVTFNASVPDGGMTVMLLGGTLVGLATLRRKLAA